MALGLHVPEWRALANELKSLADAAGAQNAFVLDAWGHLWCRGYAIGRDAQSVVLAETRAVLDSAAPPLHRGGRLRGPQDVGQPGWFWYSFASAYLLALQFAGTLPQELVVMRLIRAALPKIGALTLALPPPDGRTPGSAEGAGVA